MRTHYHRKPKGLAKGGARLLPREITALHLHPNLLYQPNLLLNPFFYSQRGGFVDFTPADNAYGSDRWKMKVEAGGTPIFQVDNDNPSNVNNGLGDYYPSAIPQSGRQLPPRNRTFIAMNALTQKHIAVYQPLPNYQAGQLCGRRVTFRVRCTLSSMVLRIGVIEALNASVVDAPGNMITTLNPMVLAANMRFAKVIKVHGLGARAANGAIMGPNTTGTTLPFNIIAVTVEIGQDVNTIAPFICLEPTTASHAARLGDAGLYIGDDPLWFAPQRDYGEEFPLWQRFFTKLGGSAEYFYGIGQCFSAGAGFGVTPLPVKMRVAGTPTVTNNTTDFKTSNSGGSLVAVTGVTVPTVKDQFLKWNFTGATGLVAGDATALVDAGSGLSGFSIDSEIY